MERFLEDCRVIEERQLVGLALKVVVHKSADPGRYVGLKNLIERVSS